MQAALRIVVIISDPTLIAPGDEQALALETAAALAPYTYVQIAFAMVAGWLAFAHTPDAWAVAGMPAKTCQHWRRPCSRRTPACASRCAMRWERTSGCLSFWRESPWNNKPSDA